MSEHRRRITTRAGGTADVRRVEQLPSGRWRADFVGGLAGMYEQDPRPAFDAGHEPPEPGMPATVARLYAELERTTDPRERAQIEEALANHHA